MEAQSFVGGLLIGAGAVYFFDPRQGARRRAIIREKGGRALRELEEAARIGARDLEHRARGVEEEIRGAASSAGKTVDDQKVRERVRAALGHVCSHTRAIEVNVIDGRVELKGPVLASEADDVLRTAACVRGVHTIDDDLERHADASGVPALQGEHVRRRTGPSPATRFVLGIGSGALGLMALARGSVIGFALGAVGAMGAAAGIERRARLPSRKRANGANATSQAAGKVGEVAVVQP